MRRRSASRPRRAVAKPPAREPAEPARPRGGGASLRSGVFALVHALARQIPRGKVATYGQLARIVGTTPRAVGFAMAALTPADKVPWHRVVNARGEPSLGAIGAAEQVARLKREGVRFERGRIDLARWGWLPAGEGSSPARRKKARSGRGDAR